MSRSILAHLSFNFYRSCQADYRHALYRSSARLSMARISPASRPEFSYWLFGYVKASDKRILKVVGETLQLGEAKV